MTEPDRGTDRAGRRNKRFLTPLQKYEIWLQLIRQEVTMAEAADAHHVVAESLTAVPLLPLRVIRDRNRGGAYLTVLLAVVGMFGIFFFLNFYL